MNYLLEALIKNCATFDKIIKVGYEMHINFVCEEDKIECFNNTCNKCKDGKKFLQLIDKDNIEECQVSYSKWTQPEKKTYSNIENSIKKCLLSNLIEEILTTIPKFLDHSYIKRTQFMKFNQHVEETKLSLSLKAVVQVDFAEGFKKILQDEVQAAHFNQESISIFTAALVSRKHQFICHCFRLKRSLKRLSYSHDE